MGMVSAVFGGVIRDVLTRKVPLIFKKEIYASACLIGGVVYLFIGFLDVSENIQFVLSGLVIFVIRLVAVKYKLELPKINNDIFGK
jgi:uncharacterized membrane protein YeiH